MDSSFDKFSVSTADFGPGDISSGFVDDAGAATTLRIFYKKVGKLYFGFYASQLVNGQDAPVIGGLNAPGLADSVARMATLLGISVNTVYSTGLIAMYGQNCMAYYNTGIPRWESGGLLTTMDILTAILAN